ncbi:MAG: hypothetical protein ACPGVU_24175 [Limisphaerales bacterium]
MKPNLETLRRIRQITEDGVVTEEEVMSMGNFLNENQVARTTWPGNVIFETLKRVFADARLDPHELKALAYILRGIELQCCGALGQLDQIMDDGVPKLAKFDEMELKLPAINEQMQVSASDGDDRISSVDLNKHECDCGDWTSRRFSFADSSPGRICRCLVIALCQPEIEKQIPRTDWNTMFFRLLDLFSESSTAFDPLPTWKLLRFKKFEWVAAWGDKEWATVYTESKAGKVERYCYHLMEGRWAYGAVPIGANAIKNYFAGNTTSLSNKRLKGY